MKIPRKSLEETLIFLLRLLAFSLPLYLILSLGTGLEPLQVAFATQSNYLLSLMRFEVEQELSMLSVSHEGDKQPFVFVISPDSTAWKTMLFLAALVFAVPRVRIKYRVIGTVTGIIILWTFNLVRVITIVHAENAWGLETALFVHDVLWELGLTGVTVAVWAVWMVKAKAFRYPSGLNFRSRSSAE